MHFFETNEHLLTIYQRAIALTISKSYAEQSIGKLPSNEKQESEKENRRR